MKFKDWGRKLTIYGVWLPLWYLQTLLPTKKPRKDWRSWNSPLYQFCLDGWLVVVMLSLWSGVLLEETELPGENPRSVASDWHTLSHNVYRVHLAMNGVWTLVMINTDCTSRCKSNYHTITTTTDPNFVYLHRLLHVYMNGISFELSRW